MGPDGLPMSRLRKTTRVNTANDTFASDMLARGLFAGADFGKALFNKYRLALQASAHYAVEVDAHAVAEFRDHLGVLVSDLDQARTVGDLEKVASSYRGEMRLYKEQAGQAIQRMRADLQLAAEAMQTFASSLGTSGSDYDKQVKQQLASLEALAENEDLAQIRTGISKIATEIREICEVMCRSNVMLVAQLADEIRTLHREIEQERRALFTDATSGAWSRPKIDRRLSELIEQEEPFTLIILWISNLRMLEARCSRSLVDGALAALVKRFEGVAGKEGMVSRWSSEEFAALLETDMSTGRMIAREIAKSLSGRYLVQENGVSQSLNLRVTSGIVDYVKGMGREAFYTKLEQMTGVTNTPAPQD